MNVDLPSRRRRHAAWAIAAFLLLTNLLHSQFSPGLSQEEIARLDASAGRLWKSASEQLAAGKVAEAIEAGEQLLAVQQRLFGDHENTLIAHNWLALQYEATDDLRAARPHREAALVLAKKVYPAGFWRLTDTWVHLQYLQTLEKLTSEQRAELRESLKVSNRAFLLQNAGRYQEAMPLVQKAIETRTKILGEDDAQLIPMLNNLGTLDQAIGDYAKAAELFAKGLASARAIYGERHPSTITAYNNRAGLLHATGDFRGSLQLFQETLKLAESTLGAEHPTTLIGLNNVADSLLSLGDYAAAEPLLKKALEIRERVLGPDSTDTATSRSNLAVLYDQLGDYPKAEELYQRALASDLKAYGEEHPTTARTLSNLGAVYESQADVARAEPLYRRSLAIRERLLPPDHPDTATSLNNLGQLLRTMGDYSGAETALNQALQMRMKTLGPAHPDTGNSLHNLATLYDSKREPEKALRLHLLTVEVCRQALGDEHPRTIASKGNLAMHYFLNGDYVNGSPLLREVLESSQRVLGPTHRDTLTALGNLATLRYYAGDFTEAERLMKENLEATRKALGPNHPQVAIGLSNLGILYLKRGQFAEAEPYLKEALENDRRLLDLSLDVQSERQQLRMSALQRTDLDHYLAVAARLPLPVATVYEQVLAWKGAVFASQANRRFAATRPEVAPLLAELQETSTRLAALAFEQPEALKYEAWQKQLDSLTTERERLERTIAGQSAEFRTERAARRVSAQDLRQALPEGFALLDFLEYDAPSPDEAASAAGLPVDTSRKASVAVFVVRKDREVVQFPLGPAAPIKDAIAQWRKVFGRGTDGAEAARELRRLLWEPLRAALDGTTTILLSPDGAIAQFPFAALPGDAPGKYLIEERPLIVVPAPQRLPRLLAEPVLPRDTEPSLLVVGNVNYDSASAPAPPSLVAERGARGDFQFDPLPGTGVEATAIRDIFVHAFPSGKARLLEGAEAAKEVIKSEAGGFRYLLLATHGFFSATPVEVENAETRAGKAELRGESAAEIDPGLLSGLALAGANEKRGILTALEVAAMDLRRVDLAVLSACETGLGVAKAGEGILGLQRAFQLAGARSTVTSLWKVDDDATRALMTELHRNLWERKMPKLEAFRAAQLSMITTSPGRGRLPRGLTPVEDDTAPAAGVSPYYWAAFVMAGDWR